MDWEVVSAIAEILGSIAVIATLAFLVVEIKNSRTVTESASLDALATGFNTLHTQIISDPEFTQLWMTGLADPDAIDEAGKIRIALQLQSYLNHYGALRKHYESGFLPKEEWEPYCIGVAAIINSPGGRKFSAGYSIPPAITQDFEDYKEQSIRYGWLVNNKNNEEQAI